MTKKKSKACEQQVAVVFDKRNSELELTQTILKCEQDEASSQFFFDGLLDRKEGRERDRERDSRNKSKLESKSHRLENSDHRVTKDEFYTCKLFKRPQSGDRRSHKEIDIREDFCLK